MPVSTRIDLTGQVALVTGAARGVGLAAAEALAREGADVVVADILPIDDAAAAVKRLGRRACAVPTDITRPEAVAAMVDTAIATLGRIDMLVHCAAIRGLGGLEIGDDEWHRVNEVNLHGTYRCLQAVFPQMEAQGYGKIVCIGSLAGEIGGLASGPNYVASKGGVHAMLKWFAKYGARRGVYVNGIAPGVVKTDMIEGLAYAEDYCPLGRFAEPADIAQVALFLVSSASNYVTGQIINVDGGHLMH